ncbi:MAG: hypothetical protein E3J90_02715 [Promethearchaeota archaeon]|nr:MAG: hypothetical protein E3J90_02715 [Candidatus Lokiarchaeota archaeon]
MNKSLLKKSVVLRIGYLIIILGIFLSSSFLIPNSKNIKDIDSDFNDYSQTPLLADSYSVLFEGNEISLNITDYGNLYDNNQKVSLSNQDELNLTYYLDSAHDWKAYKVGNTLKYIVDKRNWINNSGFQSPIIYRVNDTLDIYGTPHPYVNHNPSWASPQDQITISGATYIRVHFSRLQFEYGYDFVYITNSTEAESFYVNSTSTNVYDFYSPWISGDTIKIDYDSDNSNHLYGYDIDYYEFMNSSSNIDINSANWEFHHSGVTGGWNDHGPGEVDNATAMYVALYGDYTSETEVSFDTGAYSELFQEFTIDSGPFVEAYLSFDYYCQYALPTNDHYLYVKINNEKIFSKGMLDISELGKRKWLTSGKLYTDSWDNLTNIFKEDLKNFNISVGFRIGSGYTYTSGWAIEDSHTNIVWFDNISLVVTTKSNATQPGIDLTINSQSLQDNSEWGSSNQTINQIWDTNPIILTLNTSAPNLEFDLNTTVYGRHYDKSRINQQNTEGVLYKILENGTIYWEYYHNLYIPNQYADIEFVINKPKNWEIISALDPTLQEIPFDDGKAGDTTLKINRSYALYPGWWTFQATSPNYLNISNTKMLKQGEWTHTSFNTGESTRIKTQVNYSGEIPNNLGSTEVNLTIFDPEGNQWFSEVKSPLSNGSVFFSALFFDALNTTGGQYDYTLFWSNGTSLGGLNSSFLIIHQSSFSFIKPNDAISDSITDAFVGDIIPVQINLTDSENINSILNAVISYNWTSGTVEFVEAGFGIYETILDTSDLGSNGFYEILIESSKVGFLDYNLTLKINLGEETNVQRLQSDYNIELHANSTIEFRYYSLLDSEGIDGATVGVNISNPDFYSIENSADGYYDIEFDTSFTDNLGIFQLNFNFSAPSFEPQTHIYQFEIVEQSVNITAYVDNVEIQRNSIIDITYMEEINISTQARALIDDDLLTGGNFTWKINSYEQSLNEYSNFWYNTSIQINPSIYSPGLNLIGIQFEMDKYQTDIFYFQLLVYEQPVDLSVFINSQPILENEIVEIMYMENITISAKAFATIEADYVNGALITWQGGNQDRTLIELGADWYNTSIQIVPSNYTPGLNSIAIEFIKDNFQHEIFHFQLLVEEQSVDFSLYLNSHQIAEDQLVEVMFKQNITISARAYGEIDLNYIDKAYISWNSESYITNFIEYGANWYNLSLTFSATNFSSGINTVSIKFEKQNYTTTYFSFQLLIREQSVQLNVSINNQSILENALIEVMFKENITIAAQAYAMGEGIFISGGNITLIGEMFTFNINENVTYPTWFTTDIIIDGAYFDLGINTVSVKFEQANYSEAYFSFQFFVTAETVNLSLYVDSQEIDANSLIEITYYDEFSLSIRALANVEKVFLDGGSAIIAIGSYNQDFIQTANYWYNTSVICDLSNFDLGINSVYVRFLHPNYTSSTFYFQILVHQIEMSVNTIDFQDSIESYSGESLVIRINLTELISANSIENTTISYLWEFGLGNFEEVGNGIYEMELEIPENIHGSFKVSLIISTENVLYKSTQSSFLLVIGEPEFPIFIIWIIIFISAAIISVLGILSLRSYVILPRRRKREADLMSRTQKFKDMQNIQAIVAIHRYSGIPLYSKSYSILEKHKKELFSGFIQAIITVGEEMVGKRDVDQDLTKSDDSDGSRTILELDFKYFYCLICDRQDLRLIFLLDEKASDRLKKLISDLSLGIMLDLSQLIENWDGAIHEFEAQLPPIITKYVELYYKDAFKINDAEYIAKLRKENELNSMETRILNVIYSIAKNKQEFHLETIFEVVHEKNQDLIIDAIETLINKQIIIPSNK